MSRRWWRRWMAVAAVAAFGGGCASQLDVRYPESSANPALLSSAGPRGVAIGPVVDRRVDRTRIGVKPMSQDPIVARRPVEEIVREALAVEIARTGHSVASAGDVVLAAEVEEFWLDAVHRQATTQYIGRVAIALIVVDPHTGSRVLTRRYAGIKRLQAAPDAEQAWREVMDAALTRTMHDVATDPELAAALTR